MGERFRRVDTSERVLTAEATISFEARARPTLADVYAQHVTSVIAWAARLGGPLIDPEDVAHDVFVTAARKLSGLAGPEHLAVWLYTLTRNEVRNRRRQVRLRKFLLGLWGRDLSAEDPRPLAPDALEQAATAALVRAALERLSERQREVLVLFELEGRSGAEVAAFVGVKEANIWVVLHRARAALAREVERLEEDSK
ncbi:MAG: ECF-family polymerase sigma factor [Myxococcaceae bacterium]|nr:ECF-family polymerase sigma factor [Myxococcaceae bacterium]